MSSSTGKSAIKRRNVSKGIASSELTSLVGGKDKDVGPRIRRVPTYIDPNSDGQQINEAGESSSSSSSSSRISCIAKLEESHPRFGPLYSVEINQAFTAIKEKAWEHVLKKSSDPDPNATTTETYLAAMRNVEVEANDMYAGGKVSSRIDSDFRLMMIKDGCFFLQLALLILGCSEHLGYPDNDPIFGRPQKKKDLRRWIEAMFYVGNQIPLVVLRELMAQKFFQDVIDQAKWDDPPPSGLCKIVLHDVLVLPALITKNQGSSRRRRSLVERVVTYTKRGRDAAEQAQQQQPCDLLHGFRNHLMGPDTHHHHLISDIEADDLEANDDETTGDYQRMNMMFHDTPDSKSRIRDILNVMGFLGAVDNHSRIFPSATELKQQGIRIKKLKSGGARGIYYKSYYFWACLYLPAFPVDGNAEVMLLNLKNYDNYQQQAGQNGREVSSYLRFMSDLIQTTRDAKLLLKKGIIQGAPNDVEKLPAMLNRLSAGDIRLTQELRMVRTQIRDYSSPWIHYKGVINVVAFLTLIQTFFAMFAYFKPPNPQIHSRSS